MSVSWVISLLTCIEVAKILENFTAQSEVLRPAAAAAAPTQELIRNAEPQAPTQNALNQNLHFNKILRQLVGTH